MQIWTLAVAFDVAFAVVVVVEVIIVAYYFSKSVDYCYYCCYC